ncbi:hypothetical protein [Archaeoglobus veneficus]|uniref:hypothetical protein n=1 Tax=Archaeoglobus veneficus TaxID=58290 RepID=UPI0012EA01AE|nr:hypothetical protein [Archaeoglobus veneficus]
MSSEIPIPTPSARFRPFNPALAVLSYVLPAIIYVLLFGIACVLVGYVKRKRRYGKILLALGLLIALSSATHLSYFVVENRRAILLQREYPSIASLIFEDMRKNREHRRLLYQNLRTSGREGDSTTEELWSEGAVQNRRTDDIPRADRRG